MGVSRETPNVTTKPKCYDLANILVRLVPAESSCARYFDRVAHHRWGWRREWDPLLLLLLVVVVVVVVARLVVAQIRTARHHS